MSHSENGVMTVVRRIKPLYALVLRMRASARSRRAFTDHMHAPILMYQMDPAGVHTVTRCLRQVGIDAAVIHVRQLSEDREHYRQALRLAKVYPLPSQMYLSEAFSEELRRRPQAPVRIISLVRDPVAWAVDNVFHNPCFDRAAVLAPDGTLDDLKAGNYLLGQLERKENFDYVDQWFDRELKSVFGIDVFAEPFPVESGFATYRHDRAEGLVIRLEDLSVKGPQAIGAFLGLVGRLEIQKSSVPSECATADEFRPLRERVRLERDLCERIYSGRMVRHFYSQDMIDSFIRRWTGERE